MSDRPSAASRAATALYPVRQWGRNTRRRLLCSLPTEDSVLHKIAAIGLASFFPFFGAALFYFEQIKNICLAHIFWKSLAGQSGGDSTQLPFELVLVLLVILSILATQLLFAGYSVYYAAEILEVGHHAAECRPGAGLRMASCRLLCLLLSPLVPCLVLANFLYYQAKLSRTSRHLQTLAEPECGPGEREAGEAERRGRHQTRLALYITVCQLEAKCGVHRKVYGNYRVTSALLESLTILVTTLLIPLNSSLAPDIQSSLASIFGFDNFEEKSFARGLLVELVILGLASYSLLVIVTALIQYWHEAKNTEISWVGRTMLGLYIVFLTANKVTTSLSILNIGFSWPVVTAIFISFLLARLVLVAACKARIAAGWRTAAALDRWVDILVNTVVVLPCRAQCQPVLELGRSRSSAEDNVDEARKRIPSVTRGSGDIQELKGPRVRSGLAGEEESLATTPEDGRVELERVDVMNSRQEYWAGLGLVGLENLAGLGLEWRKGLTGYQAYHSWDVRLASLGLALLCLLLYYRHGIGNG